jgi:hypothetical protein
MAAFGVHEAAAREYTGRGRSARWGGCLALQGADCRHSDRRSILVEKGVEPVGGDHLERQGLFLQRIISSVMARQISSNMEIKNASLSSLCQKVSLGAPMVQPACSVNILTIPEALLG